MPRVPRLRETADPDLLRDYLDRAHARIDALSGELARERAMTRQLRLVIALRPFQPGQRHRRVPRTPVRRTTQGGTA